MGYKWKMGFVSHAPWNIKLLIWILMGLSGIGTEDFIPLQQDDLAWVAVHNHQQRHKFHSHSKRRRLGIWLNKAVETECPWSGNIP
ncbi:hypothetical protein C5167_026473 [Papaver somniferum]|nr:hypothetical protein C5167_026473 [Papaver somniferum]